ASVTERLTENVGERLVALRAGMKTVGRQVLRVIGYLLPARIQIDQCVAVARGRVGDHLVPARDLSLQRQRIDPAIGRQASKIGHVADQDARMASLELPEQ